MGRHPDKRNKAINNKCTHTHVGPPGPTTENWRRFHTGQNVQNKIVNQKPFMGLYFEQGGRDLGYITVLLFSFVSVFRICFACFGGSGGGFGAHVFFSVLVAVVGWHYLYDRCNDLQEHQNHHQERQNTQQSKKQKTLCLPRSLGKTNMFLTRCCGSRRFQMATYTVFDEESEFQFKYSQIQCQGAEA